MSDINMKQNYVDVFDIEKLLTSNLFNCSIFDIEEWACASWITFLVFKNQPPPWAATLVVSKNCLSILKYHCVSNMWRHLDNKSKWELGLSVCRLRGTFYC